MTTSADLAAQLDALTLAWTLPDDATPSPEQSATLRRFTGWGGLAPAFDGQPTGMWLNAADRLDEVVPAHALAAARDQVDTSFFTPPTLTSAVWRLLMATGFTGGTVLEPGCGSGAFMSTAPAALDISWTGVELDPTSARIAGLLHPDAEVLCAKLEETALRDGYFDAVVGNVPFSASRVYRQQDSRSGLALHNYFIARSVDAVRPGGYVILVTSRHTLDASDSGLSKIIGDLDGAAFVGAVRLPAGAFDESGTSVVTDIIAIRKNDTLTLPSWPTAPDLVTERIGYDWRGYPEHRTTDNRLVVDEPESDGVQVTDWPRAGYLSVIRLSRLWPSSLRQRIDGRAVPSARACLTKFLSKR